MRISRSKANSLAGSTPLREQPTAFRLSPRARGILAASCTPAACPEMVGIKKQRIRFVGQRVAQSNAPRAELQSDDGQKLQVSPAGVEVFTAAGESRGVLPRVQRSSPTVGLAPPPTAIALFDSEPRLLEKAQVDRQLLGMGCHTAFNVGDFRLHLEFRTPYMPGARGQGRGNSGVYIQRRYEVQILDSFGLDGAANECGGLYRQTPPDVNLCLPPLSWQTYDIYFRAPRWDGEGERKTENARITVLHNGYPIHFDREIKTKTGAGKPETPELFPILFQDHRDPVRFRNIWIQFPPANGDPPGMLAPLDRGVFSL